MGKKSRLIKRLDAEAAAETEARKQRDLAEGKYTVDPNTGKPVGEVNTPSTKVQMVETNSLPGFEGTSRVVTTNTKTPLADPSESFKGDRRYLDAVDIQNKRQDIANVDFSNPAQMQKAGLPLTFTNNQLEASIAENEAAELAIKNDAAINKIGVTDPAELAAIESAEEELLQNKIAAPAEIMDSKKPGVLDRLEQALRTPNDDWATEPTVDDINEAMDEIDAETQYGMTPQAQEKLNTIQKLINSGRVRTSEPAIEKLGLTDYYPDMGQPLQVGTYSGSIVGSNPIFTAKGAVFPQAVYDARRRAIQNEALKKKQQQQKLLEMVNISAAPQYQDAIQNEAFGYIQEFMLKSGGNVDLLNDPTNPVSANFYKKINTAKNLGNETKWIQKNFDNMMKLSRDEKMYVSPEEMKLAEKYYNGGYYDMKEVLNDPKKLKEFSNIYNQAKDYHNLSYYVSQNKDKIEKDLVPLVADWDAAITELPASQQKELMDAKNSGGYDKFISLSMKYMPEDRVKKWAETFIGQHRFSVSDEKALEYILSSYGKEIIPKITMQKDRSLEWYKAQTQRKALEKKTLWETHALNVTSNEAQRVLANAANYVLSNGKFDQKSFLKDLSNGAGGLTTGSDDKGLFFNYNPPADAKKPKKTTAAEETYTDFTGATVSYDDYVKQIPIVRKNVLGVDVEGVDYSKIPEEQREFVKYLEANKFARNTPLEVQTTGYKMRYKGADGHYISGEELAERKEALNGAKPVAEREAIILIPGYETKGYTVGGEKRASLVKKTIPGVISIQSGDLTDYGVIQTLNTETGGSTTTLGISFGQGEAEADEAAEKQFEVTTPAATNNTPAQGAPEH